MPKKTAWKGIHHADPLEERDEVDEEVALGLRLLKGTRETVVQVSATVL